ncbi:MAG: selenide, water dikinase SelD [Alphaproteobacteria bacterium HGW-Alphaproteobacteria-4]|nr:MAG: selenide, water dikinase SelD [Alphaproteobacteria bacterium HGW-Alphaproteobacteria-4]
MTIRLTTLAHGGGCGCKMSPALLDEILSGLPMQLRDPAMLVGIETKDDAIVYRINDTTAVVATTDFFMPVVDDPYDFGAIAAANALSDVYAVGGKPLFALAIAGMPVGTLEVATIGQIMAGGADMAARAGILIGGGHSIDTPEPIYGLAVVGIVHPDRIKRNCTARAGDVLVLGKALGVGVLSHALKQNGLSAADYAEFLASTTMLNSIGTDFGAMDQVHAMTDVTGFGLMGHLTEVCEGSGLGARLRLADIPLLAAAVPHAQAGHNTGAGTRNRATHEDHVHLPQGLQDWHRNLLFDPQTSGGLLVAVAPEAAAKVLEMFHAQGYAAAAIIGEMVAGAAQITVTG